MALPSSFDESKLAAYLEANLSGFKGPLKASKFPGGQSNPTFLIEAKSGKYVLRRKPPGLLLKSAHAVDREFRVIGALANSDVPVAKAYILCEDDDVIGGMFYLMEYIDGRVMWDPALPDYTNQDRREIYTEMCSVLTQVHSVDIKAVGLEDFGRPGNYYERQLTTWIKQYRASELKTIAEMETLMDWLVVNKPADDGKVSLVHGDFRIDNMMFAPKEHKVLALVDWELSTLGHPYADLAYQCMQLRFKRDSDLAGLDSLNRKALGIPTEEEYVNQYCELMGIDSIANWNFYLAFSTFRLAAILQGIKKRAVDGNASSDKAHRMGDMVLPLAQMGLSLAY